MSTPENAGHIDHLADSYVHDVLLPPEAEQVRAHAEGCPQCAAALEAARERRRLLESLPACEASEGLIRTAAHRAIADETARLAAQNGRRRMVLRWYLGVTGSLAAAAAMVLVCFSLYYRSLSPAPYELRLFAPREFLAGAPTGLTVLLDHVRLDGNGLPRGLEPLQGWINIDLIAPERQGQAWREVSLAKYQAGKEPMPRIVMPDWAPGTYTLSVTAQTPGGPEVLTQSIQLKREWKVLLSTDKPVYQPNQTIHLRVIALREPDLKPVTDEPVEFRIRDPKGNTLLQQKTPTSRFGIAATDFRLADEILHGAYELECRVGDSQVQRTVRVEPYVLPKFQLELTTDKPYYAPGEVVRGRVQARYFFGQPVQDARVDAVMRTTDVAPQRLREANVATDAAGEGAFELKLPEVLFGREQFSGDAVFELAVSVQDGAGHTETRRLTRKVTDRPLQIQAWGDELTWYYVRISYPDGRPAAGATLTLGPKDVLVADEHGLVMLPGGRLRETAALEVVVEDQQGRKVAETLQFPTSASGSWVSLDRAVYTAGDFVPLQYHGFDGYGGPDTIFFDVVKGNQVLLTGVVNGAERSGVRWPAPQGFQLPPDVFGTLDLCTYQVGSQGLANRRKQTFVVRPPEELQIGWKFDRVNYRPGDGVRLDLLLADREGQPQPGAISLAAVDEAVFSVISERPGLEQTFFQLDQQLLSPVYEIYPWTLEDAPRPAPRPQAPPPFSTGYAGDQEPHPFPTGYAGNLEPQPHVPTWEQVLFARTLRTLDEGERRVGLDYSWPKSFAAATYSARAEEAAQLRWRGLSSVGVIWGWWFLVVFLAGLLALALWRLRVFLFVVGTLAVIALSVVTVAIISMQSKFPAARVMREEGKADWPRSEDKKEPGDYPHGGEVGRPAIRVREQFPETLLWRPEIITDDEGRASVEFDFADSITTWRFTAGAVNANGSLGSGTTGVRVFQPFFVDLDLPVALTRQDEVAIPVAIYNYLPERQRVVLELEPASWFELLDEHGRPAPATGWRQTVSLNAKEVGAVSFRLRAKEVGRQTLSVKATAQVVSDDPQQANAPPFGDAVRRTIEVVPEGRAVEVVANGTLSDPAEVRLDVPTAAIPGSVRAWVKVYPSSFSQLVEGLDSIFQRPYGCFEQTSSTVYPNILALDYLRRTRQAMPEVEAKAVQYLQLGYQRLMTFETPEGGFDWYGRAPGDVRLTAYGLMEFSDMARVRPVDESLIRRTRSWLLSRAETNGSWGDVRLTAYVAWAIAAAGGDGAKETLARTRDYLHRNTPRDADPYTLALVANALQALDPQGAAARPFVDRLLTLCETDEAKRLSWWRLPESRSTLFHGSGASGDVEVTALATLALLADGGHTETIRQTLSWLVQAKQGDGAWGQTQATVLALRALTAAADKPLGDSARKITLAWGTADEAPQPFETIEIPVDQAEVLRQVELTTRLQPGEQRLRLTDESGSQPVYQVVLRYHVPQEQAPATSPAPLTIRLAYDRTRLTIDEEVEAVCTVRNSGLTPAPMVLLDLPVPPGFRPRAADFEELVTAGLIGKYQFTPRAVIVYLRTLPPGASLDLKYKLVAKMVVKATAPPATAYEYYRPEQRATGVAQTFEVQGRPQPPQ